MVSQKSFSQGTSNAGTDFWVAYTGHVDGTNSRLALFITSQVKATVNITAGGSSLPPVTLLANQAKSVVLDPNVYSNIYVGSNNLVESNKGIHITSDNPVIVYSHISRSARSAATLILPTHALGNEYYTANYKQTNNLSEFTLLAVEDNTQIEVVPTQNNTGNSRVANQPFTITLNKGDVYQYQSSTDLTASRIRTINGCKPLAVFSGSTFTTFCEDGNNRGGGSGDNLYQQLVPISAWGKKFVSAPFYNTEHGNTDIYRIIVSKDNTTIRVNNSTTSANGTPLTNPYAKGSVIAFTSTSSNVVEADNPISLIQYQTTQTCNSSNTGNNIPYPGDPEMTILSPIEQTLTDITVYSAVSTALAPTAITSNYINVIIKTADAPTLKIDGKTIPASQFKTINSEYCYLINDVTSSSLTNPTHRIIADGGFMAIAYGYGNFESYAYLAGSDFKNLNQFVQVKNSVNEILTNGCVNQVYDINLTLPYITNSLSWDLGNGITKNYANPVYTPIVLNGLTVYNYRFPEPNLVVYNTVGKKTINVGSLNPTPAGCDANETTKIDFEILNLPVSQFSVDKSTICLGSSVLITDNSAVSGSIVKKWKWDFGDGITETRTSSTPFTHIYAAPGDYTIKLITESDANCLSDVYAKQIHIAKSPIANFSYSLPDCQGKNITFTDQSLPAEGNIIKWTWDFDGVVQEKTSATAFDYFFATAGNKRIKLRVITDIGCESEWKEIIIPVKPNPVVDFEQPDFCLNDAVATFNNISTIADGTEQQFTYKWNFGDPNSGANNISAAKNGSHAYRLKGIYQVSLTITSAAGCETILVKSFTVNGSIPKAQFNIQNENSLCSNEEVVFEDKASVDFGEITRIEWYFNYSTNPAVKLVDEYPNSRGAESKKYTYLYPDFTTPASKNITVRMVAYSGGSCVSILDKVITLKAVPKADFVLQEQCLPGGVATFIDKSVKASSNLSYQWDFGDEYASAQNPNSSTEQNPQHTYSKAGTYDVTMIAKGAEGCADTIRKPVTISGSVPVADFKILNGDNICSSEQIDFEEHATLAFGEITRIEWYFDNINYPTDARYILKDINPNLRSALLKQYHFQYPVFHSPATKEFEVKMLAYSGDECIGELKKTLTLMAVPEVQFNNLSGVCENDPSFKFTQASELHQFDGIGIYSGPGVSSNGLFNPAEAGAGVHTITYTFTALNTCVARKTQTITIFQAPTVDPGSDLHILDGGQVQLNCITTGTNLSYSWTPSTGLNRSDIPNPIAAPSDDITYTLTVTTEQGCSVSDSVFIKMLKQPEVPNAFTPNGDGINDSWGIKYLESYPGCTVEVFNRTGIKVFSVKGYQSPWDGKCNGEDLPVGTYYYIINPQNGRKIVKGYITILR